MSANSTDLDHCNCSKLLGSCLDITTPANAKLSAYYKRSFAHSSVKNRMPVILTKLIDGLVRSKQEIMEDYGKDSLEELKTIIGEISKLKHEIQTNKQMVNLETNRPDVKAYNLFIKKALDQNCQCSYYNTIWLFAECYMYRRIFEYFLKSESLQDFDYFARQKEEQFEAALPLILALSSKLSAILDGVSIVSPPADRAILKTDFMLFLKLNLWGNKCDLSRSAGTIVETQNNMIDDISEMEKNILCDQSEDIYTAICRTTMFEIIDFVCDNAGYEMFTDFCLADFLITHQFAKQIRFFVKVFPWFISDVIKRDVSWMLERLASAEIEDLKKLGQRWSKYIGDKLWVIEESPFWTTHHTFSEMFDCDEPLFRKLARSKCTFYKGDLNYRKLLGDRNWDPVTPFEEALEGYHPSRLCTLRTLKADLICGLPSSLAKEMDEKDPDWLISGEYGVIQYCDKVMKLL